MPTYNCHDRGIQFDQTGSIFTKTDENIIQLHSNSTWVAYLIETEDRSSCTTPGRPELQFKWFIWAQCASWIKHCISDTCQICSNTECLKFMSRLAYLGGHFNSICEEHRTRIFPGLFQGGHSGGDFVTRAEILSKLKSFPLVNSLKKDELLQFQKIEHVVVHSSSSSTLSTQRAAPILSSRVPSL